MANSNYNEKDYVEVKATDKKKDKRGSRGISSRVGKIITPLASQGVNSGIGVESGPSAPDKKKAKRLKLLLLVFAVLFIIVIVTTIASSIATKKRQDSEKPPVLPPTPTPIPFQSFKPSIYADDPEVLKIEEELNILDREISTTVIKETTLNPPVVDFDINFKQ